MPFQDLLLGGGGWSPQTPKAIILQGKNASLWLIIRVVLVSIQDQSSMDF